MKGIWLVLVLAVAMLLGAATGAALAQGSQAPACKKCKSTGRLACPEHEEEECAREDAVLYCSVIADCLVCTGVGFVPCPACENAAAREQIAQKKAGVATRRAALVSLDKSMGRALRTAETAHFVLVWELDRLKVEKRWVEGHELLHLYAARLEELYASYCTSLQITEKEFSEKLRVFVWYLLQDHLDGALRFCGQTAKGGVKLMGQTPSYSVCGNKQNFNDDARLHRNIVHCVVHLLLSAQAPITWIGNIKGGWVDEGLAHWFEDRQWGICDTYCFQEANTNVDFKGGKFRLAVRKLVEVGPLPPVAEVFDQNIDSLTLPMHAVSLSYVDFLLTRDVPKFNKLVERLKAKVPTRDALRETFGFGPLQFEEQWKVWVLETYPTR